MGKRIAILLGLLLPYSMASAEPSPAEDQVVTAVVFDFQDSHVDFNLGSGFRVSGNVAPQIGALPIWMGGGRAVLVEFEGPDGQHIAPLTYGLSGPCANQLGTTGAWGLANSGQASRFSQWYRHVLGVNVPRVVPMLLTFHDDGGFGYAQDDLVFLPLGENQSFTWKVSMFFDYESCAGQEIAIESAGDVWVFVDGQLVIDHQQRDTITAQSVELDRLGIDDGKTCQLQIFYAARGRDSRFGFKVYNTALSQPKPAINPAGTFD